MKKITALFLFIITSLLTQAQFVSIPDASFRDYLKSEYPTCFNSNNELDTTCTSVINATNIYMSDMTGKSLSGIEYFDKLENLTCRGCSYLIEIPSLPKYLKSLDIVGAKLKKLPKLPATLTYLQCAYTEITELPKLPAGLKDLRCYGNSNLTSLPSLPATLTVLNCSKNQLTKLPTLPKTLTECYADGNCLNPVPPNPYPETLKFDVSNQKVCGQ